MGNGNAMPDLIKKTEYEQQGIPQLCCKTSSHK